ncbi:hypothetical protein HZS_2405, partial [Henneguya salminicola]
MEKGNEFELNDSKMHVKFASDVDNLDQVIIEKDSKNFFTRLGFIPTESNIKIEIPNIENLAGELLLKSMDKTTDIELRKAYIENDSLYVEFHTKSHIGKISKIIIISDKLKRSFKIKLLSTCIDIHHGKPALKRG